MSEQIHTGGQPTGGPPPIAPGVDVSWRLEGRTIHKISCPIKEVAQYLADEEPASWDEIVITHSEPGVGIADEG